MVSNMAEAHPVGFQWVIEAKSRGAKVVHIDPRFTRTSALADRHVPLRAGSDIAFLGGMFSGYDHETASYDPSSWHYESTSAKEHATPDQHGSGGAPIEGAHDVP